MGVEHRMGQGMHGRKNYGTGVHCVRQKKTNSFPLLPLQAWANDVRLTGSYIVQVPATGGGIGDLVHCLISQSQGLLIWLQAIHPNVMQHLLFL